MCAATGLIAGIISLGENVSGGMEHSDSVSHEETNLSVKAAPAANSDETTEGGWAMAPQVVPIRQKASLC